MNEGLPKMQRCMLPYFVGEVFHLEQLVVSLGTEGCCSLWVEIKEL